MSLTNLSPHVSQSSSQTKTEAKPSHHILFGCEPLPPIQLWRRAESKDVPEIIDLMKDPDTTDLFGSLKVATIIEHSYISLNQVNSLGKIVSHISLYDYPNIPALPHCQWLEWISRLYTLTQATNRNTLFVHLLVWDTGYSQEFLRMLLDSLFMNHNYLQNIILVVPPRAPLPRIICEYFTEMVPRGFDDVHKVQTLYLCMRQLHVRKLKIRRAVEEDNDDLIPILHNLASEMKILYGEFYIAEMVLYPSKEKEIIVAESQENQTAIGVMILSTDISYDLLNEQFEVAPFYGLRKVDERDKSASEEDYRSDSRTGLAMPVYLHATESEIQQLEDDDNGRDVKSDVSSSVSSTSLTASGIDLLLIQNASDESLLKLPRFSDSDDRHRGTLAIEFEDDFDINTNLPLHMSMEDMDTSEVSTTALIIEAAQERAETLKIPTYFGPENAFAIEVFALNETLDERLAFDFLEAAFEVYPGLDYCVITLPSADPCFAMLDQFTRVTPRLSRSFPHELYVLHRNALNSYLDVREAVPEDEETVRLLLSNNSDMCDIIMPLFQSSTHFTQDGYRSYVMTTEHMVVGVAMICPEYDVNFLRCHFTVDDFSAFDLHEFGCHGVLKHLVLSPIFHRRSRYFLKEVLRLSGCTILFYPLFCHDYVDIEHMTDHCLITAIGEMVPVRPRRQIQYFAPLLKNNRPKEEEMSFCDTTFSLYMMTPRYSSLKKIEVNARIVVVGASATGLAFLEALIFGESCTYLTFNNVTLVSPNGLPGGTAGSIAERYWPYMGSYSAQYMERISIRTYVNLVYGYMTAISRRNKYIVIDGEKTIPYEYLMLFCGEQFPKPVNSTDHLHVQSDQKCLHDNRVLRGGKDSTLFPTNVFLINSEVDALNAMSMLKRLIAYQREEFHIIVYGYSINAFCCVNALLESGISGTEIIFVECTPQEYNPTSYRNNKELDDVMIFAMQELGIKICSGFYFAEWGKDEKNLVNSVIFESKTKRIKLECLAMFYYGYKDVSPETLKALYSAGLVYDGRLVITPNFETNDPNIFAAGPMTKYKRRYYADHLIHSYFSSVEIGTKIGNMFRRRLDPTIHENIDETNRYILSNRLDLTSERDPANRRQSMSRRHSTNRRESASRRDSMSRRESIRQETNPMMENMLTPDYVKPLICSCSLPGGMNYLHVGKPGLIRPLESAMAQSTYGQVLITGDYKIPDPGFFRLHMSSLSLVETITCYTSNEIDVDNLISLYGLHERLLNNLMLRFNMGRIVDFFEYFREPWVYAIYHDRFERLQDDARLNFLSDFLPGKSEPHIIDDIIAYFEGSDWKKLTDATREAVGKKFNESGYARRIEKLVIKFIDKNQYQLPMYATPLVVRRLLYGVNNSELDTSPLHHVQ